MDQPTCLICGASIPTAYGVHQRQCYCSDTCLRMSRGRAAVRSRRSPRLGPRLCVYCGGPPRSNSGKPVCETCREEISKRTQRRRTLAPYNITPAEYDDLLLAQGGACAICRSVTSRSAKKAHLLVDHDHVTGLVRGLLCHSCNVILGHAGNDSQRLIDAARYLESVQLKEVC